MDGFGRAAELAGSASDTWLGEDGQTHGVLNVVPAGAGLSVELHPHMRRLFEEGLEGRVVAVELVQAELVITLEAKTVPREHQAIESMSRVSTRSRCEVG